MLSFCVQSAILVLLCVHFAHQVGFSVPENENEKPQSSPERVKKHEKFLNTFQNGQKTCGENVVGGSDTDALIDYIISMDKNLKDNVNDEPTKNFFGCLCKEFGLVNQDETVRKEALDEFFDNSADEDVEVPKIKDTCGGRFNALTTNNYLEGCYVVFHCLEEFDDGED
ncbi:hypothetical protein FQR65_LT12561 [Abscondita terminalis]|nr:hypothetical protein FQR65_LT12561 [Abscondita terminalis]